LPGSGNIRVTETRYRLAEVARGKRAKSVIAVTSPRTRKSYPRPSSGEFLAAKNSISDCCRSSRVAVTRRKRIRAPLISRSGLRLASPEINRHASDDIRIIVFPRAFHVLPRARKETVDKAINQRRCLIFYRLGSREYQCSLLRTYELRISLSAIYKGTRPSRSTTICLMLFKLGIGSARAIFFTAHWL